MPVAARGLVLSCALALAAGCSIQIGPSVESASWGGGSASHNSDTPDGRIDYDITHMKHGDETYLVIVAEGVCGVGTGSGPPAHGHYSTRGGREFAWHCDTEDGKTGTVTLAGTKYDLEDGGLFLLTARGGKAFVRQVKADMAKVKDSVQLADIRVAAKADAFASEFLAKLDQPKP